MAEETKNTKPADEEIEKTAEPTAGEEKTAGNGKGRKRYSCRKRRTAGKERLLW